MAFKGTVSPSRRGHLKQGTHLIVITPGAGPGSRVDMQEHPISTPTRIINTTIHKWRTLVLGVLMGKIWEIRNYNSLISRERGSWWYRGRMWMRFLDPMFVLDFSPIIAITWCRWGIFGRVLDKDTKTLRSPKSDVGHEKWAYQQIIFRLLWMGCYCCCLYQRRMCSANFFDGNEML